MQRNTVGFLGGIIGGFFKLLVDQTTFASNISNVDTVGTFSRVLFTANKTNIPGWFIYILGTGLVGWLVSRLIPKQFITSYFSSGLVLGVILWGVMNILFALSKVTTPTWSMGIGSFIVNLFSHLVLGIVLVYAISRAQIEVGKKW